MDNRMCILCKSLKSLDNFYSTCERRGRIYYQSYCKICQKKMYGTKYACHCGRYYTYSHRGRHLNSMVHKEGIKG